MNKPVYFFLAFGLMVLFQLGVPLQTAYRYEVALRKGTAFKFDTEPIDPNDPFRGKYVDLRFSPLEDQLPRKTIKQLATQLVPGQTVYATVVTDNKGYARLSGIYPEAPVEDMPYFSAQVNYLNQWDTTGTMISLRYPFERFYLEEHRAPAAEDRYREALRDSTQNVYALVRIRGGLAVLEDVVINGVSITK
ncbi:MAG: hypothetical protein DA408_13380 [Bacteroidetes bacterium]|nr:MAG: hypothetical protein C7N36_11525 [Bacteroidota bacterium]PTM11493.1 MAG: hypothetical protein DA408_13380 [Bacteroidota bacterium]